MVTVWLVARALAACPEPIGAVELTLEATSIESAWTSMDAARIYEGEDRLVRHVPCLSEAVPPTTAVAVFRALAFTRYVVGDRDAVSAYLRSVRALAPGYVLPDALVGPTHPLRALFDAAADPKGAPVPLPPPSTGALQVDGRRATTAPSDRPFLFQHLDEAGVPLSSEIVRSGATPRYPTAAPAPPAPIPREPRAVSQRWLAVGIAAAVAGGASLGGAAATREAYRDVPAWEPDRADRLRRANLGLGLAGYGLVATGATFGGIALASDRW